MAYRNEAVDLRVVNYSDLRKNLKGYLDAVCRIGRRSS